MQKELGITNIDWTQKTKAFTTPSRNISASQCGSNSTGRRVSSAKSRNSVSPNLILRSESVLGKDTLASRIVGGGVEEAGTPLRRSNRKRISPAARILRRMSRSPRMDHGLDKNMKKRLSSDLNQKQNRMNCCDDLPEQKTPHFETIGYTSISNSKANGEKTNGCSSIVNKNDRVSDNSKSNIVNDDIIPKSSHEEDSHPGDKAHFAEPPKIAQINDEIEKRRETIQDQQECEISTISRERKDLKGRIKNRKSVGDESAASAKKGERKGEKITEVIAQQGTETNFVAGRYESEERSYIQGNGGETAQECRKMTEITKGVRVRARIDEGEEPEKNPKTKSSSVAGFLFGKSKSRKKEIKANVVKTIEERDSFCIPESQEDKADNLFSPKRRCRVASKEEALNTSACADYEKSPVGERKNRAADDTRKIPQIRVFLDEKYMENKRMSRNENNTDMSTSTPVVDHLKTALAVRDATPVTDSDAKHKLIATHQHSSRDSLDGIIANLSFNDSQLMEENGNTVKDESDLFKESDIGEMSGDGGKLEDNFFTRDKHQRETSEVEKKQNVESHHIGDSISFLSKSQKDNFFRTLGSQDFDFDDPEKCLNDEVLACNKNRQQGLDVDEEGMEIEEGVMQEHFSILFSKDLVNRKAKKAKRTIASVGVDNHNQGRLTTCKAILPTKTPLNMLNNMQKFETPMYQACSEELDFGFDLSRTENKAHPETNSNVENHVNADRDGSYLSISHERIPQLKMSFRKAKETHDPAQTSLSEGEVPNLEYPSDGELDQNVCEDVDENVQRADDTLSDSFLDQAFESYLHLSSNTDESKDSIGLQGVTEDAVSEANRGNKEYSNELENNCLEDTFGELNMTPGTEALVDGLADCHYKKSQVRKSVHDDIKLTSKGRLSDDLFATPVSPAPRRRSQKECSGDRKKDDKRHNRGDKAPRPQGSKDFKISSVALTSNMVGKDNKKGDSLSNRYLNEAGTSDSGGTVSRSLCIIDVVNNGKLFECFENEWREQRTYSIALACERAPSQHIKGGIGKCEYVSFSRFK